MMATGHWPNWPWNDCNHRCAGRSNQAYSEAATFYSSLEVIECSAALAWQAGAPVTSSTTTVTSHHGHTAQGAMGKGPENVAALT